MTIKYGHAPGHVRDAACAAFEAWACWNGTGPEPITKYEVRCEPCQIPVSRVCGFVWGCTDIVPGSVIARLLDEGLGIKSRTYAACARAIIKDSVITSTTAATPWCTSRCAGRGRCWCSDHAWCAAERSSTLVGRPRTGRASLAQALFR
jgi:hypothetical protein